MKERNLAIIITIILIILGLFAGLITLFIIPEIKNNENYYEFNFYKSELDINGTQIKERLYYIPDKDYHTLFRNFQSTITSKNNLNQENSVMITSVKCQEGNPYFKLNNLCYLEPDFTQQKECPDYTENNEYGCAFGNYLGFKENSEYYIESEYILNPENLFKINEKYYIKFIVYGRNNHKSLIINNNLFIKGNAIYTEKYLPKEYVIIYILYEGETESFNIIPSGFEYDSVSSTNKSNPVIQTIINRIIILVHLLPALLFFFSWYFFGKELTEEDVPEQLSTYPNKRKPWEVAAFFNPPFGKIDSNFISTMLFDFYRRKIIDLKLSQGFFKKELMIKINNKSKEGLDKIESEFLKILSEIKDYCPEKYLDKDFFNFNKSLSSFSGRTILRQSYLDFQKTLDKESKIYIEKKGFVFFIISVLILGFVSIPFVLIGLLFLSVISLIIAIVFSLTTSLLTKYKKDFYTEYKKWQAFRKWLKGSPSMREHGHKAVVLWGEYLVYATALGVSKQVLKDLKNNGLIDKKKYYLYTGVNTAVFSSAVSSGGGFGGAGAGGVGGGGGGGR